eukprot:scpid56683/ scgid7090/ 
MRVRAAGVFGLILFLGFFIDRDYCKYSIVLYCIVYNDHKMQQNEGNDRQKCHPASMQPTHYLHGFCAEILSDFKVFHIVCESLSWTHPGYSKSTLWFLSGLQLLLTASDVHKFVTKQVVVAITLFGIFLVSRDV